MQRWSNLDELSTWDESSNLKYYTISRIFHLLFPQRQLLRKRVVKEKSHLKKLFYLDLNGLPFF